MPQSLFELEAPRYSS